jgi:hypothetical protein
MSTFVLGDFSFAAAYLRAWAQHKRSNPERTIKLKLTATSLDSEEEVSSRYGLVGVQQNLEDIRSFGGQVIHGVDATALGDPEGPLAKALAIENVQFPMDFDVVQFQFPHTGDKHRIQTNRELLRGFFQSSKSVLRSSLSFEPKPTKEQDEESQHLCYACSWKQHWPNLPQVVVTLARGQGGTVADGEFQRAYCNSWQVVEQGASAGLVLAAASEFDHQFWDKMGYESRGYKLTGKEFRVGKHARMV